MMKNAEHTIEYTKTGYSNVQEIIRFVDTKTEILIGLVTATFGGITAVAIDTVGTIQDGVATCSDFCCQCPILGASMALVWSGFAAFTIVSLVCSVLSLTARPSG